MNILFLATTFPRWKGDTEPDFIYRIADNLSKKGCHITVLAPHSAGAKREEVIGRLRVHRFRYFWPSSLQKLCYEGGIIPNLKKNPLLFVQVPFLVMAEFFAALRIIRKEHIDFVHAHWIIPQGMVAAFLRLFLRKPYLTTAHAGDVFTMNNAFLKFFGRMALKNASFCTVNSKATREAVLKVYKREVHIIPSGTDFKKFSPRKREPAIRRRHNIKGKMILFVGRLVERKGVHYLIESMPLVLKRFPDTVLVIGGVGPEKERFEQMVKQYNLSKNVIFTGRISVEELPRYYAAADVFVLPSITTQEGDQEGLGVVLLEAMASGTAVVGTRTGGIPDIVIHGKTGLLVRQKDSKGLAKAILRILADEKLKAQLVKNAFKHVKENFSWGRTTEMYDALYKKMGAYP